MEGIFVTIGITYDINKAAYCVDVCSSILPYSPNSIASFFVGEIKNTVITKNINYNSKQVARCSRSNQSGTNIKIKTACSERMIIMKQQNLLYFCVMLGTNEEMPYKCNWYRKNWFKIWTKLLHHKCWNFCVLPINDKFINKTWTCFFCSCHVKLRMFFFLFFFFKMNH